MAGITRLVCSLHAVAPWDSLPPQSHEKKMCGRGFQGSQLGAGPPLSWQLLLTVQHESHLRSPWD